MAAKHRELSGNRSLVGQKVLTEESKRRLKAAERQAEDMTRGDADKLRFAPVRGRDVAIQGTAEGAGKSSARRLGSYVHKPVSEDSRMITGEE